MLQVYLDQLLEACAHLTAYIDGVDEFESLLGRNFINMVNNISSEASWILHDLDFN